MRDVVVGSVICLLVIGCLTEVAPQSKAQLSGFVSASLRYQEWQRYTVKEEEFSVVMPALPAMSTSKRFVMSLRKNLRQIVLGSYADGVAYAVYGFENPERQSLNTFIQDRRAASFRNVEWNNPVDVLVNGFTGKQFEFSTPTSIVTMQFFETKEHLYQFVAVGAQSADPRVQQFFSSIILGKKTEGTQVQDGIGAELADDQSTAYASRELDRRVVVVTKPEPSYTDSARQGRITGTVVLKLTFGSNGGVSNIHVVSGLPFGLTEEAIKAAKKIRFVPAMKNGQLVSTWLQLEYNFNIY